MKIKPAHRFLAAFALSLLAVSAARAADWTQDYASAVIQAKKEHKMILLDFTGSDWCVWCKRTDSEVFDTKAFKDFADKNLVLVTVDFPKSKVLPDDVKAQNAKLQEKYGIEGYPTLVVLSSNEKVVFSQMGYKPGGPDAFIAQFPKPQS
jgi:thioredoxin-related protein